MSNQKLNPREIRRMKMLKELYSKDLNLTPEEEEKFKEIIDSFTGHHSSNIKNSVHSSSINGDPVVFKSIDDIMHVRNEIPSSDGEEAISYYKDDLTNYSKVLGLNKRKSTLKRKKRTNRKRGKILYNDENGEEQYFSENDSQRANDDDLY